MPDPAALLLIAHGSREEDANADLRFLAENLGRSGEFLLVVASYLELAEPNIEAGAQLCVSAGAKRVVLLPYFLSAGIHVRRDLTRTRERLSARYPDVQFFLADPLGRHPLLEEVVQQRAREVLDDGRS